MKKFTTALLLIVWTFVGLAQNADLKQAIKHFENKNLGLAEKEIHQALKTSFSSSEDLAKATYYYFVITTDLHLTEQDLAENVDLLGKLGDAYLTCVKNDDKDQYLTPLNERVESISVLLEDQATIAYANKNYLEYFHVLDYRLSFLEMIDRESGRDYQELAAHADMLGLNPLKIKYLKKMLKSGFNERHAFKELLATFYELEKFETVDELLEDAKEKFPSVNDFAVVEIKRLRDRDLRFSALQVAQKVLLDDPSNTEVIYLEGVLNAQLNEHEQALSAFQKVAQLEPDHHDAQLELGKHFYKFSSREGYLDSAKVHLEKAYTLNSEEEITRDLLHDVYMKLGLVQEAVTMSSY